MPRNRLAIPPDLTHYDVFLSGALARTVLPFLDGEARSASRPEAVQEGAEGMGFGRRILFGLAFALGAAALQACAPGPQGGPAGGGAPLGYAPGEEARLYERLNRQWQRPLACQYLRRFPTGPHYAEVRDRVFLFYGRNACNLPFEREFRPV